MSASNWATCPRCSKRREDALAKREAEIAASYGKVPIADFDNLRFQLSADRHEQLDATFREDYEIYGAEDGRVKVSYSGRCTACGLDLTFEDSRPLDLGEES
jgi:hypothetical protein